MGPRVPPWCPFFCIMFLSFMIAATMGKDKLPSPVSIPNDTYTPIFKENAAYVVKNHLREVKLKDTTKERKDKVPSPVSIATDTYTPIFKVRKLGGIDYHNLKKDFSPPGSAKHKANPSADRGCNPANRCKGSSSSEQKP